MFMDPVSLSPDPLYGRRVTIADGGVSFDLYPHELVDVLPPQTAARKWGEALHLTPRPAPLRLRAGADGRAELLVDFGTEIEGELELACRAPSACTVYVTFGESIPEACGWGVQGQHPVPTVQWHMGGAGLHRQRFASRGFRFIRIAAHDVTGELVLSGIVVRAWLAYGERHGDFRCDDARMQRAWQASVYTARLCARRDAYWDGVKRDRLGWYGDARVTQLTTDLAFADPAQARGMLLNLQTDSWANEIPGYSFDAVAMFRQMLTAHGTRTAGATEIYAKVKAMLAWAEGTQTGTDGRLVWRNDQRYFFDLSFVDWAAMPVGGRLEEQCCLQCKYLEALRNAEAVARWLGKRADAEHYRRLGDRLARLVTRLFWRAGKGFVHTLNEVQREWGKPAPASEHRMTYTEKVRLGPSRPSRHSSALAMFAGLCDTPAKARAVLRTFDDPRVPALITGYFMYYQQWARAACGDPAGAIIGMRDFVGEQLEADDSPTVSEYFEREVRGIRRWSLHGFPKSMCHGWSSGIVPIAARWLAGVEPLAPGYGKVALRPAATLPMCFAMSIPTPHGPINAARLDKRGPVVYEVPAEIELMADAGAVVKRT